MKHVGKRCKVKGWRGAHGHAVKRLDQRFGLKLTPSQWAAIVDNARAGLYPRVKPRSMPARAQALRKSARKRSPLFRVPLGCASEGWVLHVTMAINTADGIVVTVTPEHEVVALDD